MFPTGNYTLLPAATPSNVAANVRTDICAEYYTVNSGDTLTTIAANFFISSSDFLALNPGLNSQGTNLLGGAAYCVLSIHTNTNSTNSTGSTNTPSNVASGTITQGCTEYYTVVTGDSCPAIESKFGISDSLFRKMNPEINSGCTNILLGGAYCVQTSNSTGQSSNPTGPPSNVASGTITTGCTEYYTVVSGDSCPLIETKFNISVSLFKTMNPEINSACSNILAGEAYCVQTSNSTGSSSSSSSSNGPPSNVASGTVTTGCTKYYTVVSGDSCATIQTRFGISITQFLTMNSEVNSACTNILLGEAYCVQSSTTIAGSNVPTNIASGTTTSCKQYYTIVSGDNCNAIETKFGITDSQFHTWNPEVNSACSNILLGEAYCVSA